MRQVQISVQCRLISSILVKLVVVDLIGITKVSVCAVGSDWFNRC